MQWVVFPTRNLSVVSSYPIKGSFCFLDQETLPETFIKKKKNNKKKTLPALFSNSTGWLQEQIPAGFQNRLIK